ncbi:Alpha/beta hydrolase fold-1 [Nemania sp. FL0916]|nr:Alpha/beta hydrolase fold-1 [Nemania sp. FL0916]
MSKPSFIVVTGSFSPAGMYEEFADRVRARGYDIKVLQLPSVSPGPGQQGDAPPGSMYDDAALIAREVEALADMGKEVILVAHSYGGMPATQSTKGLSIHERQAKGKIGGLVKLAYMSVLLTTPGGTAGDVAVNPLPPADVSIRWLIFTRTIRLDTNFVFQEAGWMSLGDTRLLAPVCYSDLPPEEGLRWASMFALHSAVSFTDPLTHAGYKDVPVSYLFCEDDLVVPVAVQKSEIEMLEKETGHKIDVTTIKSGHCPTSSCPDKVVDWLHDIAQQV